MRRFALADAGRFGAGALAALALLVSAGCGVSKKDYVAKTQELNLRAAKIAELTGERDRLAEQVADAAIRREALERELALAQEAVATTGGSIKEVGARYDALIRDLAQQKDDAAARSAELAGRLGEAESRVAALTADLAASRQELTDTRLSLGETQEQLAERERKLRETTETYDQLLGDLKQEISDGQVKITRLRDRLTVNLVDRVLFDSGSAAIKANGKKVLLKVAEGLRGVKKDKRIQIEGHTDDVPIKGPLAQRFPTNWELSTARATSVTRFLQEQGKLDPARLTAAGYGPYRPVGPNDTPEGRAGNRRIEIVLVPVAADEAL